jgi:putative FmdB family regulatory protein
MPLYEYQCDNCGHRFEKIQKFSDPPVEQCPKCGSSVHKLMSSPAFQFKGSGWYVTDYAKKDTKEAKESKESKASTESTETKESKDSKETTARETPAAKTSDSSSSSPTTSTSAAKDSSKGST